MTWVDPTGGMPPSGRLRRIEERMGALLRIGVGLSAVLVLGGLIVSVVQDGRYITDRDALSGLISRGPSFSRDTHTLFSDLCKGRGRAIAAVGLLVLIATPVARVAVSIVTFLIERDRRFAVITTLVLMVLVLSVFLGRAV